MSKYIRITEGHDKNTIYEVLHENETHYMIYSYGGDRKSIPKQGTEPFAHACPWAVRIWFQGKPDRPRAYGTEQAAITALRNICIPWDYAEMFLLEPTCCGRLGPFVSENGLSYHIVKRWVRTNGDKILEVSAPRRFEPVDRDTSI